MSVSIEDVLRRHVEDYDTVGTSLRDALVEREEGIADFLRLAGAQFGMYPFIISKVLMDAGLGVPPTEEQRAYIDAQFVAGMEQLQEEYRRRQQGGGE